MGGKPTSVQRSPTVTQSEPTGCRPCSRKTCYHGRCWGLSTTSTFWRNTTLNGPGNSPWTRSVLSKRFGGLAKSVEYYGSIVVPGMRAKPIIDILVGILLVEDWVACEAPLERLGYDYAANAGVPGHHIFGRGRNNTGRTHFVHIVGFMGDEWRWNLALRGLRVAYVAEKERAAAAAPEGRVRYNELKGPFINKIKATLTRADSGRESRDTASQELRCILRAQLLQWLRYRRNPV